MPTTFRPHVPGQMLLAPDVRGRHPEGHLRITSATWWTVWTRGRFTETAGATPRMSLG